MNGNCIVAHGELSDKTEWNYGTDGSYTFARDGVAMKFSEEEFKALMVECGPFTEEEVEARMNTYV